MRTMFQQNIEDGIYKILKEGNIGKTVFEKFKNQSIENLADIMTEGFKTSPIASTIKTLDSRGEIIGFEAMCNAAFKEAILRLLKEEFEDNR